MRIDKRLGIRIGFLIHDVSRLRRAAFERHRPQLKVTRSESWMLTGIARRYDGISQTDLARVLGLGKVSTGEFLSRLERRGLVSRRPDPRDRRSNRVTLTPRGNMLLKKISQVVVRINNEVFREFSAADLHSLADGLKRMKLKLAAMQNEHNGRAASSRRRRASRPGSKKSRGRSLARMSST